jgi:hypothetical protein
MLGVCAVVFGSLKAPPTSLVQKEVGRHQKASSIDEDEVSK